MPIGFKGTRGEIVLALKKSQTLTTRELASIIGVTPNALRRHLKELELEGVVRYRREIRGVGGPVFAYSLTETGEALFPRAYDTALAEVLELVRAQSGEAGVVELFRRRWETIAEEARAELVQLPIEARAERLASLLTSLGYMAELRSGDSTTLTEHNCAIRIVAQRFPEVCEAEERFISDILGTPVTRQAHIATGGSCCEYCIQPEGAEPGPVLERITRPARPASRETA
jgi:DeoR family suf operon transcriptional repressor